MLIRNDKLARRTLQDIVIHSNHLSPDTSEKGLEEIYKNFSKTAIARV